MPRRPPKASKASAAGHRRAGRQGAEIQENLQKLQKVLADRGVGSRRGVEAMIADGRVQVNGADAHIGQRVAPDAAITVDGKPVRASRSTVTRVLLLNKRAGVVCTRDDPERRRTIFDDLPCLAGGRWIGIGRLDIQSTGLYMLTTDGQLAHRFMHPSTGLDREYAVRIDGRLRDDQLAALADGIMIDGEEQAFSDIQYYNGSGRNHWYHVVLMEGRNREVRKLFSAVGVTVSRLKRVRYGPVVLPSWLRVGAYADMSPGDIETIYKLLGLPKPTIAPLRDKRAQRSVLIEYPELGL